MSKRRSALLGAYALVVALAGCGGGGGSSGGSVVLDPPLAAVPEFNVTLVVTDENGDSVGDADVNVALVADTVVVTGSAPGDSRIGIQRLSQPTLVVVEAPGYIPEPVVIDRDDEGADVSVRLLSAIGSGGERRVVMHFAGDSMIGRRYVDPASDDTAVLTKGDGGASARSIVNAAIPLFTAADIRSLNLETVVGELDDSLAYPKKRFLLQSPPEALHAIAALEADVVTLGNNHARDWLDVGVQSLVDALDGAGLSYVGAGIDAAFAREPLLVDRGGYSVAFLSYTSVNGDFVNDNLPGAGVPIPPDLAEDELWQYEERVFGFAGVGANIPVASRRIREAWIAFEGAENGAVNEDELAALWAALVAVYPEMQDWVARRGHGGANHLDLATLKTDIDEVRANGAELVVVQFHSGFQFQEVKSEFVERASQRAIDDGADLVVVHHPHVLQGFEWYQNKLIAHSLGNFVFDQDFLSTFNSAVLRVVFQETDLLEARVYPLVIDRYRPVPATGRAARNIVQILHERTHEGSRSERVDGEVKKILRARSAGATVPFLEYERGSARIESGVPARTQTVVSLTHDSAEVLDAPALTRSRGPGGAALTGVLLGRDRFDWGDFEDRGADGESKGGHHWVTNASFKRIEVLEGSPEGVRGLRLRRADTNKSRVLARPRARVTFARNQVWEEQPDGSLAAADGEPSYSLVFRYRLEGTGKPLVRMDVYDFDDTNPTADPESTLIRSPVFELNLENDGEWHDEIFDFPAETFADGGGLEPNAALFYLGLDPPGSGLSVFIVDECRFVEWRHAADLPDSFYAIDVVRAENPGAEITRTLEHIGE